jgi:hypothetical protein
MPVPDRRESRLERLLRLQDHLPREVRRVGDSPWAGLYPDDDGRELAEDHRPAVQPVAGEGLDVLRTFNAKRRTMTLAEVAAAAALECARSISNSVRALG